MSVGGAGIFIPGGADILHVVCVVRRGILVGTAGRVRELASIIAMRATSELVVLFSSSM